MSEISDHRSSTDDACESDVMIVQAVLDSLNDGVMAISPEGVVWLANDAAGRLLGLPRGDLHHAPITRVCPELSSAVRQCAAGNRLPSEAAIQIDRRQPHGATLRVTATPALTTLGARSFITVVLREAPRRDGRIQPASWRKHDPGDPGDLAPMTREIVHEFNNMLVSIVAFAGFLKDDLPPDSRHYHYACQLVEAGKSGRRFVEALLAGTGRAQAKTNDLRPAISGDSDRTARTAGPAAQKGEKGEETARPRILVIDDDEDVADVVAELLDHLGFDAIGSADPLSAVRAIKDDPGTWDAVLIDQRMPQKRGLDIIRDLRLGGIETPVYLLSGTEPDADARTLISLGVAGFIRKPVTSAELGRILGPLIRGR